MNRPNLPIHPASAAGSSPYDGSTVSPTVQGMTASHACLKAACSKSAGGQRDSAVSESSLPYITEKPTAFRIRIQRRNVKMESFVPITSPATRHLSLARAIRIRDQFLIAAGPSLPKRSPAAEYSDAARSRSNTGIPGISETTKWVGGTREECFCVYLGKHHRPIMKRIYYGRMRSRETALQMAIALRASVCSNSQLPTPISQ